MQALQDRFNYLRRGEALAAVALPIVFVWKWMGSATPVAWELRGAALAMVCFILLQGTLYWHLKMRSVDQRRPLPAYFATLFRSFQVINIVAIAAMLVALLRSSVTSDDMAWTCWMLALVVLEQINYYHYQLMYDTRAALDYLRRNRRLRKAALALDLARNR